MGGSGREPRIEVIMKMQRGHSGCEPRIEVIVKM